MHRPLTYRPEIDGLRAFAVIAVLIYHLNHDWLPGGYLGVDIFFVISGFLITSLIVKDCAAGDFSFKEFYLRRARRILPAMLTVTALTGVAAYFLLFPDEMKEAARACKKALLCYSNYYFAKKDGYFDPSVETNPFLHTWSLGVEEQFYFVFPLVAIFAYGRGWLKARCVGFFVILGLGLSCYLTFKYPTHAFFALESRAWELGAGAWLAVAASRGTLPAWFSRRGVASMALGLLLISVILLRNSELTPAPTAVFAVLGTVLFIGGQAGSRGSIWHGIFASAPLRFVGRISYSLYLVHWPLIVFVRAWRGELTPSVAVLIAVASVLLAVALHYAVEQPLRHRRKSLVFLAGLAATSGVLLWCAGFAFKKQGSVNPTMSASLSEILPEWQEPRDGNKSPYLIGRKDAEPSIGLWGDSHAMALIGALDSELKQRGLCCEVWTQPGNLPVVGVTIRGKKTNINEAALAALSRPSIQRVIISARWSSYLEAKLEDYKYSPRIVGAANPAAALAMMRDGLDKTLTQLRGVDRKIVLVYPVPEAGVKVPYLIARKMQAGESVCDLELEAPAKAYMTRHDLVLRMFDEMCKKHALLPVHPDQLLIRNGVLPISRGHLALYFDDDHLSHLGSIPVVKEILDQLTSPPTK